MNPLPALQLFRIFKIDRLRDKVRQDPDELNLTCLKTVLQAIDVIQQTSLISSADAEYLIQISARDFETDLVVSPHERRPKFQYEVEFGVISEFVDLISDLVSDESAHVFLRSLRRRG
ncbi:MAG TPA: hypothetical protein VNY32_05800, partial [Candidatus Acidoferrales bacterium]|nr:hypothetical protein [Candidatus Acidoferrales bacterium]